ncbi:family 16 glycosylhydrolase [Pelagicoccus mobilis]|uniref:Family 16 glycosylhydrolase n=1 Tax=Pelagicoccus mobilis TaxID=415221 RepID=A0A934VS43_9BACT|nr:family 16 glycosylhydrolase [Pelagicoccus mobilis]MBK1880057.1 family 16 glycosylhydrolase [Pelagicoccus mobilis]
MNNCTKYCFSFAGLIASLLLVGCDSDSVTQSDQSVLPLSDPNNEGGWILNTVVSDEFEEADLDEDRWFIVGKFENGKPVYKDPDHPDREVWIGRAPAQFSGRNYRLEDGKLKLETRWEPDFPFSTEPGLDNVKYDYANITTAAVINRKLFKYGYIEVLSKAADAEVSSALWMTRHEYENGQRNNTELELDIYEHFGSHRIEGQEYRDRELWWTIHDWDPKFGHENGNNVTYTEKKDLGFRVADGFHTYGFEWTETGIRYFIDGKLFSEASREDIEKWAKEEKGREKGYVIEKAMHLWLDSESFPWRGYPDSKEDLERNSPEGEKDDGVVDYEIEYVRVWQRSEHMEQSE